MNMQESMRRAEREQVEDTEIAKRSELWPKAIAFLRGWLQPNVQAALQEVIHSKNGDWPAAYHFGWGMGVRNGLRENGFGEQAFGVKNLDNIYVELVEEAVRL